MGDVIEFQPRPRKETSAPALAGPCRIMILPVIRIEYHGDEPQPATINGGKHQPRPRRKRATP